MLSDGLPYPLLVVRIAGHARIRIEVRVLGEYDIVQVLSFQAKGGGLREGTVDKLAVLLVDDIVVHNYLLPSLRLDNIVALIVVAEVLLHASHGLVANANESLLDEVHFVDLLGFVNYYHVVVDGLEPPRQQALAYVEKHYLVQASLVLVTVAEKALVVQRHVAE